MAERKSRVIKFKGGPLDGRKQTWTEPKAEWQIPWDVAPPRLDFGHSVYELHDTGKRNGRFEYRHTERERTFDEWLGSLEPRERLLVISRAIRHPSVLWDALQRGTGSSAEAGV